MELAGRRARWRQLGLLRRPLALKLAVLQDLIELKLSGFPSRVVTSVWAQQDPSCISRFCALELNPSVFSIADARAIQNLSLIHI